MISIRNPRLPRSWRAQHSLVSGRANHTTRLVKTLDEETIWLRCAIRPSRISALHSCQNPEVRRKLIPIPKSQPVDGTLYDITRHASRSQYLTFKRQVIGVHPSSDPFLALRLRGSPAALRRSSGRGVNRQQGVYMAWAHWYSSIGTWEHV